MWGYKDDTAGGILKGYRISAPHAAERNVGFAERTTQGSSERTIQIQTIFIMQHIYTCNIRSFFQNSIVGAVLITPHSAPLHVGLKSCILSGYHAT
ncbi:hypothetical protein Barb4_04351 [Bacteroidales bacterium Barb4]|nr:hypothetical protein Barb4_04351 [Bacteroidales bacterium Barb4]